MELNLKGPVNGLVNKSDFPQSGLVLRESCNCPSSTCYFPVVLTPAPPSGDLGLALPDLCSPPVAVISLVVDRGRGLPETKHWPGAEPYPLQCSWASPVAQLVKNLPAMWETRV